ncbi:hypothetical protein MMPV_005756 [Pyropia vietnamensis]
MGRKKPFMPRAQTRTYQVVYRPLADTGTAPGEGDRVLRFVPAGNQRAARAAGDAATSVAFTDADPDDEDAALAYMPPAPELAAAAASYHRKMWELGEYGFPDDGYDYSQHFRPMTGSGTGGVFLLAPGAAGGRGAAASTPPVEEVLAGGRTEREAEELRQRDKDVDDILAALESDEEGEEGRLGAASATKARRRATAAAADDGPFDDADSDDPEDDGSDFDDDFVATANAMSAKERAWRAGAAEAAAEEAAERRAAARAARSGGPDGVRLPRLADAQLEELLAKTYADSGSDEEDDEDSVGGGGVGGGSDSDGGGGSAGGVTATAASEGRGNALADYADVIDTFLADFTAHGLHDKVMNRVPTEGNVMARARLGTTRRPSTTTMTTSAAALSNPASAAGADASAAGPSPSPAPGSSSSDSEEEELVPYTDTHHTLARWDCETVLSTYTTTENLPSVIGLPPRPPRAAPIKLDRRYGAPAGHLPASASAVPPGLRPVLMAATGDADSDADHDGEAAGGGSDGPPAGAARPRNESADAKRARKAAIKAARRGRRAEKAAVRAAFAAEGGRQARHATAVGPARVAVHFGG